MEGCSGHDGLVELVRNALLEHRDLLQDALDGHFQAHRILLESKLDLLRAEMCATHKEDNPSYHFSEGFRGDTKCRKSTSVRSVRSRNTSPIVLELEQNMMKQRQEAKETQRTTLTKHGKATQSSKSDLREAFAEQDAKRIEEEEEGEVPKWRYAQEMRDFLLGRPFEGASNCIVCIYVLVMYVQLDFLGWEAGYQLGLGPQDESYESRKKVFDTLTHVFNVFFGLELLLRLLAFGRRFFHSKANVIDGAIVATDLMTSYILDFHVSFARIARLLKAMKFLRAFRAAESFSELRVLVRTIIASIRSLLWCSVLLILIVLASGILTAQLVGGVIRDSNADPELRVWAYKHYGTASRASYTMLEVILSGGWPNYARRLVEEVTWWFALFWAAYVLIVVFAVTRILTALFLRNTLKVAAVDDAMMAREVACDSKGFAEKVARWFGEMDTDGDCKLGREEMLKMLMQAETRDWLTRMKVDRHELNLLFDILDDGNGNVSFPEFFEGCLSLREGVRPIDNVEMMRTHRITAECVEDILEAISGLPELMQTVRAHQEMLQGNLMGKEKQEGTSPSGCLGEPQVQGHQGSELIGL
mmetsp:Transcript_2178/g.5045  ORF Transcript_2178/g.5045 Transcript_2178/m.5045 type:complete len:588 (-) Transcript_2178:155-1918(-)